jgi:hypothetical protein
MEGTPIRLRPSHIASIAKPGARSPHRLAPHGSSLDAVGSNGANFGMIRDEAANVGPIRSQRPVVIGSSASWLTAELCVDEASAPGFTREGTPSRAPAFVDVARLRISKSHLCDIERRRKAVSPDRASRFALELGYSEEQFVRLALQQMVEAAGLDFQVGLTQRGRTLRGAG